MMRKQNEKISEICTAIHNIQTRNSTMQSRVLNETEDFSLIQEKRQGAKPKQKTRVSFQERRNSNPYYDRIGGFLDKYGSTDQTQDRKNLKKRKGSQTKVKKSFSFNRKNSKQDSSSEECGNHF